MRQALADGSIDLERVGHVNAHATSTHTGDIAELQALHAVFGDAAQGVWISATKSVTGHLLGAAGGLEAALTVMAIDQRITPPTINLEDPVPEAEGLEVVTGAARERDIDVALSNSFGFGGTNVTLAFGRV